MPKIHRRMDYFSFKPSSSLPELLRVYSGLRSSDTQTHTDCVLVLDEKLDISQPAVTLNDETAEPKQHGQQERLHGKR